VSATRFAKSRPGAATHIPIHKKPAVKTAFWTFLGSVLLVVWFWLTAPGTLPIHEIRVSSEFKHVSVHELQRITAPALHTGFFSFNAEALQEQLTALPWVKTVEIRRVWPDRLKITIIEQKAAAVWNYKKLVNQDGDIFAPGKEKLPTHLPYLEGIDGQQHAVLKTYDELNLAAKPRGLRVVKLRVNARQSHEVELSNGMLVILGQGDIMPKFKRLIQIYPQLEPHDALAGDIHTVDLRYPNGMAVSRRPSPEQNLVSYTLQQEQTE
jgi:cell division protein FtsQ